MTQTFELVNPSTLKERWPRFSAALARHDALFALWDRIVLVAEANAANGQRLSLALRRCPDFIPLHLAERAALIKEALADRREMERRQSSLMPTFLWGGVETLGAQPPGVEDRNTSLDFALRPRFRSVSQDFISYATEADGAFALTLARRLERRGRSCWMAGRELIDSDEWNEDILNAVEACGEFLLLLSAAALASDFMRAEVKHAFEQGKRVTVVHLAPRLKAERMDMRVKNSQHLRWYGREEACFEELILRLSEDAGWKAR